MPATMAMFFQPSDVQYGITLLTANDFNVVKFDHFGTISCFQNGNNWFLLEFLVQRLE